MRILITGGTGFFGRAILRRLLLFPHSKWEAIIISRNPIDFKKKFELFCHPNIKLVKADLSDVATIRLSGKFDYMIHAAAESTIGATLDPAFFFHDTVRMTESALTLMARLKIKKLLFVSSGGVYVTPADHRMRISETDQICPPLDDERSSYSLAKIACEHLVYLSSRKLDFHYNIARCFSFYGQDMPLNVHFAIGNFIEDALTGPTINIKGDGTAIRSYMHQNDLADWLLTIMSKGENGAVYNVGSEEAISISALAQKVRDLLAPAKEVQITGVKIQRPHRSVYVPSTKLIRSSLGVREKMIFEDEIRNWEIITAEK